MIADLHCHYPMHLLPGDHNPHGASAGWFRRLRDRLEAAAEGLLSHFLNNPGWLEGWRVTLEQLEAGDARIVCSVLYWPPAEFDFDRGYGANPEPGYFDELKHQMRYVEDDLQNQDPDHDRLVIVRTAADLDEATAPGSKKIAFVHCVEGGFHLGPDPATMDANVRWLAEHGVVYITIAHLFYRGVAANSNAIPFLSDKMYDKAFHQDPGTALTALGEALVRAMYEHRVLIDVSHMRQDAIDETFALVEKLDQESGRAPQEYPIIASHIGVRDVVETAQNYNLSGDTIRRIAARNGVIGLILAQHQLGITKKEADSRETLKRHIDAIAEITGGHKHVGIGSDIDGFINPTLSGIDQPDDFPKLEGWIRDIYGGDADAILHGNTQRVLSSVLSARTPAA
jgi:microsomal dipeptidase-like Zn-dependent dipeptidase